MRSLTRTLPALLVATFASAQAAWQALPKPPIEPRFLATLHAVGDDLVVFGGQDVGAGESRLLVDGAVLATTSRTWTRLPDAPIGRRQGPVVVPIARGIYVGGGLDGWDKVQPDGAVLDANSRKWRPVPAWPVTPRRQPSIAVDGDTIALWGGVVYSSARVGDRIVRDHTYFADGVLIDAGTGTVTAIPEAPIAARLFAATHLQDGQLFVFRGSTVDGEGRSTAHHDGAVFDLRTGEWQRLPAPSTRAAHEIDLCGFGDSVFVVGNAHRRAFGCRWDRVRHSFAPLPDVEALDLGMDATRVFAGTERMLLFNAGMKVADDEHQAFWLTAEGLTALPLPAEVRARQQFSLAHTGDDVVLFGGNHEVMVSFADGPEIERRDAYQGPEGDGVHFDLAKGTATAIAEGPLAPRARPLIDVHKGHLYVLWGDVDHKLQADGAVLRLR